MKHLCSNVNVIHCSSKEPYILLFLASHQMSDYIKFANLHFAKLTQKTFNLPTLHFTKPSFCQTFKLPNIKFANLHFAKLTQKNLQFTHPSFTKPTFISNTQNL